MQPAGPMLAEMDARRVERVLRNLIGNALDHAEGKPVEVRVGANADTVAVTVRDYGVGLRPGEAHWCSTGSGAAIRPAAG